MSHYVMSDIHGQYGKFQDMLSKIAFTKDDVLYIIGDVIDRGPDGGYLLLDALTTDNIVLMLGNHEHMLIQAEKSRHWFARWLQNGAEPTIQQIENMGMTGSDFAEILKHCPVVIPNIKINNRVFSLAHARPATKFNSPVSLIDIGSVNAEPFLWDRHFAYEQNEDRSLFELSPNKTHIIGHTPVSHCEYGKFSQDGKPRISRAYDGRLINIDCGCASGKALGCLRLEDEQEFYT